MAKSSEQPDKRIPPIEWLSAERNPWGVPVLDVRPVTQGMLSTTANAEYARNSVSMSTDDGRGFIGIAPASDRSAEAELNYSTDGYLADGSLFSPGTMEHKWAIFFYRGRIIFVRSWLREVRVIADVERTGNGVRITRLTGTFVIDGEGAEFSFQTADFLIRSHSLRQRVPAPLPPELETSPQAAAIWCMNVFGNRAEFAAVRPAPAPANSPPLRSNSLLHICIARGDRTGAIAQLDAGVPVALLARDGLTTLHWAVGGTRLNMGELLLERGCPVDVRSAESATPLMNAVQSGRTEWVEMLISHGADVNARDARGFTSLHRAAETGKTDLVRRLLSAGANATAEAEGHTALSLVRCKRNEVDIVRMLRGN